MFNEAEHNGGYVLGKVPSDVIYKKMPSRFKNEESNGGECKSEEVCIHWQHGQHFSSSYKFDLWEDKAKRKQYMAC